MTTSGGAPLPAAPQSPSGGRRRSIKHPEFELPELTDEQRAKCAAILRYHSTLREEVAPPSARQPMSPATSSPSAESTENATKPLGSGPEAASTDERDSTEPASALESLGHGLAVPAGTTSSREGVRARSSSLQRPTTPAVAHHNADGEPFYAAPRRDRPVKSG